MTAVVGLLNKKGVALAADSAVTRNRGFEQKVTKNGNKMVRLSDVVPISVMLTGNGCFMRTQWDIIIRHYRQHRGDIKHETVEACLHDFFRYIADHALFCESDTVLNGIKYELDNLFRLIDNELDFMVKKRNNDGLLVSPRAYQKAFMSSLNRLSKNWLKNGVCPHFQDYTQQDFHKYAGSLFDEFIEENSYNEGMPFNNGNYPLAFLTAIREPLENALMIRLTTRRNGKKDHIAELVFSGYGEKQVYPSLVSTIVYDGFDNRVNYHVRPEDVICISDQRPVAICRFAQKDVTFSILSGMHRSYSNQIVEAINNSFTPWGDSIFTPAPDDDIDFMDFNQKLGEIETEDLRKKFFRLTNHLMDRNIHVWEKALKDYDLQSMAALAESLIDLTGFHRILTFQQEGVGGPVDVAVISKNDGFVWLNRKSWYHHKDVGGRYGKFGV
jgi:hypothetical protein